MMLRTLRFENCILKQSHFDFLDKVMNVLLHVAAGTYCIPRCKGLVYTFHLVEDILGGNDLAQGGTPQARAAVMKIIQKFFQNRILSRLQDDAMKSLF